MPGRPSSFDALTFVEQGAPSGAEPFEVAGAGGGQGQSWAGDFVVHLHDATRRHYDLRLQVGGVLKSFAVPRGPSLDPTEKRLAVQTEDHPLSYLDFEDTIPEGNYGAGSMIVWDIGRVQFLEAAAESGLEKGKLDFVLHGRKVRGRFALVETTQRISPPPKQRQWLLIKKQDAHCVVDSDGPVEKQPESVLSGLQVEQLVSRTELQEQLLEQARALGAAQWTRGTGHLVPMMCASSGASLHDRTRLYELKLDGVRVLAERKRDAIRMSYRTGRSALASFPEVARALASMFVDSFVVDGELVALDESGKPSFQRLARRFSVSKPFEVRAAAAEVSVVFLVFDVLRVGDLDVTSLPLVQRKQLLATLAPGKGLVRYLDHIEGDGRQLYALCEQQGLEGVISKRREGAYIPGARTDSWVKHKREQEDDFVVVGWVSGKGSRAALGALELATYRGNELIYRGRVGSGFDDRTLTWFTQRLEEMAAPVFACAELPQEGMSKSHPLVPQWVVRVRYLQWTPQGRLRMAVFLGKRPDMTPTDCRAAPKEELEARVLESTSHDGDGPHSPELAPSSQPSRDQARTSPISDNKRGSGAAQASRRRVVLSNQHKVFWPQEGYTKGDLLTYYEAIAPVLLPQLENRPVMLVRYPDGVEGKSFYQWNVPPGTPRWVRTLALRDEEKDGKSVTTFLVDSVDSLLHIVNLGCIPIHVLAARASSLDECDFLTIDFDLGEQPFSVAVRMALELRQMLTDVGLEGYPKTSGQSGLHVLIPMGRGVPFAAAKSLVELLGRLLQVRFSEQATMERRVSMRGGRAYIDTGQTGRSRTIVAPYSVRAHPGARVSTPLFWDEVHLALRPERYTMFTVPDLVEARGCALGAWLDRDVNLNGVIERLARWIQPGKT